MPAADPSKIAGALPLRDIHLPPPPGWWPPAPGWWFVTALLLVLFLLGWALWRRILRLRYRRQALRQLADLGKADIPANNLVAELSMLLRRTALCAFPEANCAGLHGEAWLSFLDRPLRGNSFTAGIGRCLENGPYQKMVEVDRGALLGLCRQWLRRLPPAPRRRRTG